MQYERWRPYLHSPCHGIFVPKSGLWAKAASYSDFGSLRLAKPTSPSAVRERLAQRGASDGKAEHGDGGGEELERSHALRILDIFADLPASVGAFDVGVVLHNVTHGGCPNHETTAPRTTVFAGAGLLKSLNPVATATAAR